MAQHGTLGIRDPVAPPQARLQPTQIERVLRGQQRLELGLDDVRRSVDRLWELMRAGSPSSPPGGAVDQSAAVSAAVSGTLPLLSNTFPLSMERRASARSATPSVHGAAVTEGMMTESGSTTHHHTSLAASVAHHTSLAASTAHHASCAASSHHHSSIRSPSPAALGVAEREVEQNMEVTEAADYLLVSQPQQQASRNWSNRFSCSYTAHSVFESLAVAMARSDYQQVKNLIARNSHSRASQHSLATLSDKPQWHSTIAISGCVVHPASRICSVLDGVRAIFLLNDVVTIPYVLAWDVSMQGAFYVFAWFVVTFWTIDLILNFCTGYIIDGNIVMYWPAVARHYLKRGFSVDFLALAVEVIDLVASTAHSNIAPSSLQGFKVLRFFKVTRLIRIVAKLRAGLLVRIRSATSYFIQVHGLIGVQHTLNFAAVIVRLLFVIAWLGHAGACIWYKLEQTVESSGTVTWQAEEEYPAINSYVLGLYWSVSTMFSGASFSHPVNEAEACLTILWLVMGALFVTSVTSTLAASLIEAQEKQQDVNKKIQALTAFMAQQKTPILLSLAVQANFNEKLLAAKPITELDLPFLDNLAPALRAALRENQYSSGFLHLPFFRMLSAVHDSILQTLAFEASTPTVVKDGEEVFSSRQEVEHAILLSRGTMKYTFSPTSRFATGITLDSTLHDNRTMPAIASINGLRTSTVNADAWICEYALLLSWATLGNLVAAEGMCELLLVSTELFTKAVTAIPLTAAVAASYAVHLCEMIHSGSDRVHYTDIDPGIDHDVIVSTMHVSIRGGIISRSILELLRRQNRLLGLMNSLPFGGKGLADLEREVLSGKSHLVIGPDGPSSINRVVRLVVLHLTNKDGDVCVQLAELKDGHGAAKFHLPGCKVWGDETPEEAVTRLLDEELRTLAEGIKIVDVEPAVEYGPSASYGMRTKYIKYIHTAELLGEMEMESSLPTAQPPPLRMYSDVSQVSQRSQRSWRNLRAKTQGSNGGEASRGLSRSRPSRLFKDWIKSHPGDPTVAAIAALRSKAFCRDDAYTFATQQQHGDLSSELKNQGSDEPLSPPTAGFTSTHTPFNFQKQGVTLRAYRWVDESHFELLKTKRREVEMELEPQASALTGHQWHRLLSWRMKLDSTVPEDGGSGEEQQEEIEEEQIARRATTADSSAFKKVLDSDPKLGGDDLYCIDL